ncbi:hypothetical protein P7C73_g453, partial [Tremellales sp. Uapishka_1]
MSDQITITSLTVHLANGLGPSAFNLSPPPPCPIQLTIKMTLDRSCVPSCVSEDSMPALSVNYSSVSKEIYAFLAHPNKTFHTPEEVLDATARLMDPNHGIVGLDVDLELPRSLLVAKKGIYSARWIRNGEGLTKSGKQFTLTDLRVNCVIGLHPHERREKQGLEVDAWVEDYGSGWDHKSFADTTYQFLEQSNFGTLESLIDTLASSLLARFEAIDKIGLSVRKPSALPFAIPSISIERTRADFLQRPKKADRSQSSQNTMSGPSTSSKQRVFIALGSNIGDRIGNIQKAVKGLQAGGCVLKGCSRLYESEPMYVEDQDRFINGAVELETELSPLDLLRLLKRTEKAVGRTKTFTNGPRVVDLDLVFYGDEEVKIGRKGDAEDGGGIGWLECPHASLAEREFVLRPLVDIAPDFIHPITKTSISNLLSKIPKSSPPALQPIIPFPYPAKPMRLDTPSRPRIMHIFNATPDSFSDGSSSRTTLSTALAAVRAILSSPTPPPILDIGGMSTRPNSEPCSEEDELARIIPLIQAIRTELESDVIISVDTYRPNVAKAAVEAGASCINDVRGGREDGMLEIMAAMDIPVVLMHSRGDSTTMLSEESKDYSVLGGVVKGVKKEMKEMITRAEKKGVKRWNIILDPGLGFAKSNEDSLRLLKGLREVTIEGYPFLVGASRKGFVGNTTGVKVPKERGAGDAGINAWCVSSGVVDVLRVHEGERAEETVRMVMGIRDVESE